MLIVGISGRCNRLGEDGRIDELQQSERRLQRHVWPFPQFEVAHESGADPGHTGERRDGEPMCEPRLAEGKGYSKGG